MDELQKHAKGTRSGRNGHTVRGSFLKEFPEEAEAESSQAAARPGQAVAGRACSLGAGLLKRSRSETGTAGRRACTHCHQTVHFHMAGCACLVAPDPLRPHGRYSLPGASVPGIFQPRILEWVAISSQPRDPTRISCVSCTGRRIPYRRATWEAFVCDTNSSLVRASPPSDKSQRVKMSERVWGWQELGFIRYPVGPCTKVLGELGGSRSVDAAATLGSGERASWLSQAPPTARALFVTWEGAT